MKVRESKRERVRKTELQRRRNKVLNIDKKGGNREKVGRRREKEKGGR